MCCVEPKTVLLAMSFWHRPSTSIRWVLNPSSCACISELRLKKLYVVIP